MFKGILRFQLLKRNLLQSSRRFYSLPFYNYVEHDYAKSVKLWYYFTLGTVPVCLLVGALAFSRERAHMKHLCTVDMTRANKSNTINKPFPWGDGETPLFEFMFKDYKERQKRRICNEHNDEDETEDGGKGEKRKCVRKSKP